MNLIQKIARGDMDALFELYERHKTRVYRLSLSLSGDPYLAEDITQETFLRIQDRAAAFRSGSETAWVIAIARNLTYDALRRRSREVLRSGRPEEFESSAFCRPPSRDQGTQDAGGNLYFVDLIGRLAPKEREVVCLRILGGLPWNEIGKILGQSKDACRKRYERALGKLRKQLSQL